MQEFEEYLSSKKIDAKAFKEKEAEMWKDWCALFTEVHPNSFSQQKLYLINTIRRRFPIKESAELEKKGTTSQAKPKPKFKIPNRPKKSNE
ncbi:hypothetical protein OKW21_004796 [Catalinimonas alkaloidigena]|uniref:hypothetical protein n=1 Tax=Catalinimonas alkaloidigena TaxID=1075417 RepID=UPI0024053366|nr:hypothetical protein [Catalinimonas alkaloidigena]MDF9799533.1 hypothetical protein [Catalinimonas alkaloidigena]